MKHSIYCQAQDGLGPCNCDKPEPPRIELSDELIDAHLNTAYATSGLNGGMVGESWNRIVARRFFALGTAVGLGLVPPPLKGERAEGDGVQEVPRG